MKYAAVLSLFVFLWELSVATKCPYGTCVLRGSCKGRVVYTRFPYTCGWKSRGYVCCVKYRRPHHSSSSSSTSAKDKYGYGTPGYHMDYYDNRYASLYGGLSKHAKEIMKHYRYKDECGVRNESPKDFARISTGYLPDKGLTSFGEFPWHVALLVRQRHYKGAHKRATISYRYHCGATLIHIYEKFLVLTAAHCVKGIKVHRLKVHMGEWNLRSDTGELFPAIERKIARVFIHSGYNPATYLNDLALLQLDRPVNLNKTPHVTPACLPKDSYRFENEKKCYIVGWGDDVYKPRFGSNILKATTVTYTTDEDCDHKLHATLPKVHDDFVLDEDLQKCITGGYGRDACVGDGGGAVMCALNNQEGPDACHDDNCRPEHYFVAGIISFGSPVCGEGSVTVITDIVEHVNWIHTIINPGGGLKNYNKHHDKVGSYHHGRAAGGEGSQQDNVTNVDGMP